MDIFRHFFFGPPGRRPPDTGLDDGGAPGDDPMELHRLFEEEIGRLLRSFGLAGGLMIDEGLREAPPPRSLREQFLKRGYEEEKEKGGKVDSDLDERMKSGHLDVILRDEPPPPPPAAPSSPWTFSMGRSEVLTTVTRPDGSVETERTSRDSEGNEETTTCRIVGDKQYCVIRRRTKDGREETTERLVDFGEKYPLFDRFFR